MELNYAYFRECTRARPGYARQRDRLLTELKSLETLCDHAIIEEVCEAHVARTMPYAKPAYSLDVARRAAFRESRDEIRAQLSAIVIPLKLNESR